MVSPQTVRRVVLTGSIAAITLTGTIYGAQLKSDVQTQQRKKEVMQLQPEVRIAQLEEARERLVQQKREIERRVENFRIKKETGGDIQQGRGR